MTTREYKQWFRIRILELVASPLNAVATKTLETTPIPAKNNPMHDLQISFQLIIRFRFRILTCDPDWNAFWGLKMKADGV